MTRARMLWDAGLRTRTVRGPASASRLDDIADLYEALAEIAAEDADRTEEQQAEDYAASLAGEPR